MTEKLMKKIDQLTLRLISFLSRDENKWMKLRLKILIN